MGFSICQSVTFSKLRQDTGLPALDLQGSGKFKISLLQLFAPPFSTGS